MFLRLDSVYRVRYHPPYCPPSFLLEQKQFLSPLDIKHLFLKKYVRIFLNPWVARIRFLRLYPHIPFDIRLNGFSELVWTWSRKELFVALLRIESHSFLINPLYYTELTKHLYLI